jgi:acetyl-CoA acetyltransferase
MAGSMNGGNIVIIGAAETDSVTVQPDMSQLELHAQAAFNALDNAGLKPSDVDGIATTAIPFEVAHHLGIKARWLDGTMVGGCSYMLHVRHAAAAIAAGAADVILITHGESGRSRNGVAPYGFSPQSLTGQFEAPFGATTPYSTFTVPAMAYMKKYGLDRSDLAEVVVAQREYAVGNPRAMRQKPVTVEQILDDSTIAYPFNKDMICVVTDAGGALVVTSAERAKDMPNADKAVYLLGSGESHESTLMSQMEDLTTYEGFRRASAEAFATSGLTHAEIDHLMCYDAFAHLPLYMMEDLGFVKPGEAAAFHKDGETRPGGKLPTNTSGGGLSYTHSGMYGMFAIQEAVRQLRGEAFVQMPNVKTSFVQGVGFFFGAAGSLVLSNEAP